LASALRRHHELARKALLSCNIEEKPKHAMFNSEIFFFEIFLLTFG